MDIRIMDVKSQGFDEMYTYNKSDLGCTYKKDKTILKVWAPTADAVRCHLNKEEHDFTTDMKLGKQGVWELELEGDFEGYSYVYHVYFDEQLNIATDPYARASTVNHQRTYIIDPSKCRVDHQKDQLPVLDKVTDAILYELHVRDFSTDVSGGMVNRGKYLSLTEDGVRTIKGGLSGVDYLSDLGVTHIQLLPVYDFGTVNEEKQYERYNWGYDPVQYNVPEGSYASEPNDPYSRIIELKKAIAHLHSKGLRVIMDVVYNHMFDKDASAFEKIVPGYYFRTDDQGNDSNGSFCGNDLDSTRPMVSRFILESTRLWIEDYGFDGFRFDLMGILDINTMNQIADQTLEIDPNAMIYGEGWNMPTFLPDEQKATMMNHQQMPHIAHFSDVFRETIKGGTMEDNIHEGGYGSGNLDEYHNAMFMMMGTSTEVIAEDETLSPQFSDPKYTINYVECHDNHTLWDKLTITLHDQPDEVIQAHHRFITSIVLLSQGIPFIHAGQEFYRSKMGEHNSYNASDEVNMIRWDQKDAHESSVKYVKDLIQLRKSLPELRCETKAIMTQSAKITTIDHHGIKVMLNSNGRHNAYKQVDLFFNPNRETMEIAIEGQWLIIFDETGLKEQVVKDHLTLAPLSVTCIKQ